MTFTLCLPQPESMDITS